MNTARPAARRGLVALLALAVLTASGFVGLAPPPVAASPTAASVALPDGGAASVVREAPRPHFGFSAVLQQVVASGTPPPSTGQGPCVTVVGQSCGVNTTAAVLGIWTKTGSGSFTINATGPAGSLPLSIPTIYLPTTNSVESFPCSALGAAAPFTTSCTGNTVGDLLLNATVTVRFALAGGGTQDVTGTATGPGVGPLTQQLAITQAQAAPGFVTGQAGVSCATVVSQVCTAVGGVTGQGVKTSSQTWNLTATVPAPPPAAGAGTPFAVFSTTSGIEALACAPLAAAPAAGTTVNCRVTTVGDALQGSGVAVVFPGVGGAAGPVAVGIVTGPGAVVLPGAGAFPPLLPPPPPLPLPPLPPPGLVPPPPFVGGAVGSGMPSQEVLDQLFPLPQLGPVRTPVAPSPPMVSGASGVPLVPEADSLLLVGLGLLALGGLVTARRLRGRPDDPA
ncbi:MAG TPA: hypothetical protein VII06_18355 [Chloroflexota bacterium]